MSSQPELSEYTAIEEQTRANISKEAERLNCSLPFYFFTIKYNYIIFLSSLLKQGSGRKDHLPKYEYMDGIFSIFIESDTFSYSYADKKWYFSSTRYPNEIRLELSEEGYMNSLKLICRKLYGLKFIFPRYFA